jgi:hypothetical protein
MLEKRVGDSSPPAGVMTLLLIQFGLLQTVDLISTLLFPAAGLREANPLIHWLAGVTGSLAGGLLVAKGAGAAVAVYCWRTRRARVLRRANVLYACVAAWNLCAILLKIAAG